MSVPALNMSPYFAGYPFQGKKQFIILYAFIFNS